MDQVNSLAATTLKIVDYKTGKPKKTRTPRKICNFSLYALAAREIFEWNPYGWYSIICRTIAAGNHARREATDEAQKVVQEAAADIRAGEFATKPGFVCAIAPTSRFARRMKRL